MIMSDNNMNALESSLAFSTQFSGSILRSRSRVKLSTSIWNLPSSFSKNNLICVLCTTSNGREWNGYGMTEMISDNLNPKFAKTFTLDYDCGEVQPLKFEVYNVDDDVCNVSDLRRHDLIGEAELILADIVAKKQVTRILKGEGMEGSCGSILVVAVELQDNKYENPLEHPADNLEQTDFLGEDASTKLSIATDCKVTMDLEDPEELWKRRQRIRTPLQFGSIDEFGIFHSEAGLENFLQTEDGRFLPDNEFYQAVGREPAYAKKEPLIQQAVNFIEGVKNDMHLGASADKD